MIYFDLTTFLKAVQNEANNSQIEYVTTQSKASRSNMSEKNSTSVYFENGKEIEYNGTLRGGNFDRWMCYIGVKIENIQNPSKYHYNIKRYYD